MYLTLALTVNIFTEFIYVQAFEKYHWRTCRTGVVLEIAADTLTDQRNVILETKCFSCKGWIQMLS